MCTYLQCGRLQPVYITYRLLWMLWWLAVLIYDLHNSITNDIRWPIFMTNWAYAMLTLGCILQFAASLYHVILKVDDNTKMPVFYKIVWIFYEFPSAVAIGVSLMFWFLLFGLYMMSLLNIFKRVMIFLFDNDSSSVQNVQSLFIEII